MIIAFFINKNTKRGFLINDIDLRKSSGLYGDKSYLRNQGRQDQIRCRMSHLQTNLTSCSAQLKVAFSVQVVRDHPCRTEYRILKKPRFKV